MSVIYDTKNGDIDMAFEPLDSLVRKPMLIIVEETLEGLTTLEIVDAEGTSCSQARLSSTASR